MFHFCFELFFPLCNRAIFRTIIFVFIQFTGQSMYWINKSSLCLSVSHFIWMCAHDLSIQNNGWVTHVG